MSLKFSLHNHNQISTIFLDHQYHHISFVFHPPPPLTSPPPPNLYCFSFSTTTFILFSHHCHHHHLISIVFPRYCYHHHYIYFVCSTLPPPLSHFIVIPPPRLFIVGWCWVVWEVDVGSIICNGQGENNKNVVMVVIRKNRNVDVLVEDGNQKLSK